MGEVWSTQSAIPVYYNGSYPGHSHLEYKLQFGIMFAADVTGQLSVRVDELGFNNVSNKQWLHIQWIAFASKDAAVKMYLLL